MNSHKILMACFPIVLAGCLSQARISKDLTKEPSYSHVVGKRLRTKLDLAVYRFKGKPLVVSKMGGNPYLPPPDKMKGPFPFRSSDATILGVLPAGSELRVVQVREEGSSGMSFIRYYAEIERSTDAQWAGKVVYADLTTVEPIPKFRAECVEEL